MALTIAQLKAHVRLAAGGDPSTTTGYTVDERIVEIINHAGQQLYTHPWRFRERTSTLLSLVGSQAYIDLPSDCGDIIKVTAQEPYTYTFHLITPQEFANLSQNEVVPPVGYLACLSQGTSTDGQPSPRLDLYPTPSANDSDAIRIRYRVKWQEVTTGTATTVAVQVAPYAEQLLIAYVRAIAEGGEDGTTDMRLAQINAGPTMDGALGRDGIAQDDYGKIPLRRRFGERGGPPPWGYVAMRPLSDSIEMATTYEKALVTSDWSFDASYTYMIPATTHMQGTLVRVAYFIDTADPKVPISISTTVNASGDVTITTNTLAETRGTVVIIKR